MVRSAFQAVIQASRHVALGDGVRGRGADRRRAERSRSPNRRQSRSTAAWPNLVVARSRTHGVGVDVLSRVSGSNLVAPRSHPTRIG